MPGDSPIPTEAESTPLSSILITNPLTAKRFIKRKHALQAVARGLADWVGSSNAAIRFRRAVSDHREQSARKSVTYSESCLRRGYDADVATHMATLDQIRGLPCVAPEKLIRAGRERFSPRALKCGPVSSGIPAWNTRGGIEVVNRAEQ